MSGSGPRQYNGLHWNALCSCSTMFNIEIHGLDTLVPCLSLLLHLLSTYRHISLKGEESRTYDRIHISLKIKSGKCTQDLETRLGYVSAILVARGPSRKCDSNLDGKIWKALACVNKGSLFQFRWRMGNGNIYSIATWFMIMIYNDAFGHRLRRTFCVLFCVWVSQQGSLTVTICLKPSWFRILPLSLSRWRNAHQHPGQ